MSGGMSVTYPERSLWAEPLTPPRPSLQARFEAWLATPDGQAMYGHIRTRALRLYDRGWRHFGIAALWEAARYDQALAVGPDAEGYRANNSFRSRLARRLMEDDPVLEGFFETRVLSA
jgi:hypothetical protein